MSPSKVTYELSVDQQHIIQKSGPPTKALQTFYRSPSFYSFVLTLQPRRRLTLQVFHLQPYLLAAYSARAQTRRTLYPL